MVFILRASLLCVSFLCTPLAATAASDRDCSKWIFNHLCLGGSTARLPQEAILYESDENNSLQRYSLEDGDRVIDIETRGGIVTQISRKQPPGDWLNFTDWKVKLVRIYGRGEEIGQFPAYATSRSSRLNAINAGKGFAHTHWQQAGWSVALIWNHRDYILLLYALDVRKQNTDDEGL